MTKTCGLCGLKDANGRCIATHEVMPSDTQACVNYDSAPLICHNCNNIFPHKMAIILQENEETYFFCPNCADQIGQCGTCSLGDKCDFQTNPSPIPLKIRRESQHGPIISVTEEMNPERIAITCKINCECFDPENGCLKKSGVCGKWKIKK